MNEKIIEKLQKLMAHEKSAREIGSAAEADAFAAKVSELLLEHKLSMSEVEIANVDQDDPIVDESFWPHEHGANFTLRHVSWQLHIAVHVSKLNFCEIMSHWRSNGISIVGRKQDVAVTKALLGWLIEKAMRESPRRDRRDWLAGYTRALINRCTEMLIARHAAEDAAEPNAVYALIRTDQLAIQEVIDKQAGPRTKLGANYAYINSSREAFDAGHSTGSNVSLSGDGLEAKPPKELTT